MEVSMSASNTILNLFGYEVNVMAVALLMLVFGLLFLFYRIQRSEKLDFADLITKNGESVSLTKVLQLIGGLTSTWIVIKLALAGTLTEGIFGLYLTYVASIEGYSKFIAAKYGYKEKSVKDTDE
jgi:hypothetical protein